MLNNEKNIVFPQNNIDMEIRRRLVFFLFSLFLFILLIVIYFYGVSVG